MLRVSLTVEGGGVPAVQVLLDVADAAEDEARAGPVGARRVLPVGAGEGAVRELCVEPASLGRAGRCGAGARACLVCFFRGWCAGPFGPVGDVSGL